MCNLSIENLDFSRPRVRYNGRVLDKCALSSVIHDFGFMYHFDTTWTDIYWYQIEYSDMVDLLKDNLSVS